MAYTIKEYLELIENTARNVEDIVDLINGKHGPNSVVLERRYITSDRSLFKVSYKLNNKEVDEELIELLKDAVEKHNRKIDYLIKHKIREEEGYVNKLIERVEERRSFSPSDISSFLPKINLNKETLTKKRDIFGIPLLLKDIKKKRNFEFDYPKYDILTKNTLKIMVFAALFPFLIAFVIPLVYNIILFLNVLLLNVFYGVSSEIPDQGQLSQWIRDLFDPIKATIILRWFKENYEMIITLMFLLIILMYLYKLARKEYGVVEKIKSEEEKLK